MPTVQTGKATEFIDFTRASNATVTDSNGVIKWSRHNLLLASEQLDASSWTKVASTVSANTAVSPNGTTTADKIAEDNTTSEHLVRVSSLAPGAQTFSVFLKAAERTRAYIYFYNVTDGFATTFFDLSAGTVTSGSGVITSIGSGWYLCSLTRTATATDTVQVGATSTAGVTSYAGTTGSGIFAWGAHLYRSDMGMQANTSAYPMYNPTTPKNLLGFTENFDNAAWGKTGLTVTANTSTSPNGLVTADTLNDGSATSNHYMAQTISTVAGSTYTASVYGSNVDGTFLIIDAANLGGASNFASAVFNLSTGAVAASSATGAGYSVVSTSITSVGGGVYRCSLTFVAGTTTPTSLCLGMANSSSIGAYGLISYTGSSKSIIVWGAQLSDSASLDPYTPNHFAAPSAAAYYGPRLDYDPVTLAAKGLLVEEQRTNLLVRSEEFDNVNWAPTGATISANTTAAPSGVVSAETLVEDTSSGFHRVYQSVTCSISTTYTLSVFVKAAGRTQARILETTLGGAFFDLSSATILSTDAGVTASIQSVGNGWYRCRITATTSGAQTLFVAQVQSGLAASSTYIGTGIAALYLYGAQLEAGSFATSYIPTTSATVTRSADVAQVGTAAFPYSATEGTLVASYSPLGFSASAFVAALNDGTGNNVLEHVINTSTQNVWRVRVGGANQCSDGSTTTASGTNKIAGAYKDNDFASTANGATVISDTTGSIPTGITQLGLGNRASAAFMSGWIRQITYIPRRLSNAELQSRTA